MIVKRRLISLLLALLTVALLTSVSLAQDSALARFIHLSPDSPAIDVYINGELAAADLFYGEDSAHLSVPSGKAELAAYVAGTSANLFSHVVDIGSDAAAILLSSSDPAQIRIIAEDLSPIEFGMSRLIIVNALEDESGFGIVAPENDQIQGADISYGTALGPFEVLADSVELVVSPDLAKGQLSTHSFNTALFAGTSHLLVIHGSPHDPQLLRASAATEADSGSGRIRFVHAIQGATAVDLKINDQMIIPSLIFASPSVHIAIPAGSQRLTLSTGAITLKSMDLEVRVGQLQTVVVMGSPATLTVSTFSDSQRDLNESSAVVSLINAVPNSFISRLQLDSGAIVAIDVGFGEAGGAAQIVPGKQSMTLIMDIGEERGILGVPSAHYFGGSYYSLIALSGSAFSAPRLLITETSLKRGISATLPELNVVTNVAPASASEERSEDEVESAVPSDTDMPAEADTTEGADAVVEVVSTAEADAPEPVETPAEDDSDFVAFSPFAIINLDPGARLQLRQYPTSTALSLGLLAPEEKLLVLGRRGPTEIYLEESPDLPVDLSDYTGDPAAALYPVEDLEPADTWVFVMFKTPDGGALFGWVNALYLQVFDTMGVRQRLASLPLVRQNQPGSALNTSLRPPELADHITARVHRLNPDAFLNVRAANDSSSEVLTQIPSDASLDFVGLDDAGEWAFIEYRSAADHFRGWVSADYVQLLLNDEPVGVDTLRALDETVARPIDSLTRGSVRSLVDAGATPTPLPDAIMEGVIGEVDLYPGAMLHLRRHPDANAESLALIPARTQLAIDGITENTQWLKATFDDQEGWIAAQYVMLLLRGRLYYRPYVENLLPVYDD